MKRILLLIILAVTALPPLRAQLVPAENQTNYVDSLRREFDNGPYFGLYKDNYFTVGTTVGVQKPSRTNSDVKFQISIAQKLTRSVLPWHTYIFLMYTQKTFWNVFEKSLPMHDLNFNPGIGWSKPFFNKDRYVGKLTLLLEHESNGRDSIQSRSWNRISIGGSVLIDPWIMVYGKVWIPIIDGQNNRDILNYCGIYQTGVEIATLDRKFIWDITFVKRKGWNLNFNTIFEFSWRFHKKSNQYFFLQYYNGYGESLLDYNQFHSRLRAGIVIKPKFFSEF
ncbi:MAG: phospholipase A [Porphyromonadaceae bacterium]|nr:phospholipase A [Porphyromonadaceae bacterium]MDD6314390.1 phospholipase A [Porphyromonadaceae bacterium]